LARHFQKALPEVLSSLATLRPEAKQKGIKTFGSAHCQTFLHLRCRLYFPRSGTGKFPFLRHMKNVNQLVVKRLFLNSSASAAIAPAKGSFILLISPSQPGFSATLAALTR
jgi:hypothetical protein